jgi:hypothetical protein
MRWIAAFVLVVASLSMPARNACAAQPGWPISGDLSGGAMYHRDLQQYQTWNNVGFGALYLGWAGPTRDGALTVMVPGVEGTIDGVNGPYQWSIGAGSRLQTVWRLPNSPCGPFPDVYLYTRVTPFLGMRRVASADYLGSNPQVSSVGEGIRFGVGFTAPRWSTVSFGLLAQGDWGNIGGGGDDAALCCLAGIAACLLNHGELTYELYHEAGIPTRQRFGWRIGIGF